MLVRFFEQSDIFRFVSLILLILLLLGKSFFLHFSVDESLEIIPLSVHIPWRITISLFLIFLQSVFIFFISNQFKLIKNDSILVSATYVIMMGLFPGLVLYPGYYLIQLALSIILLFHLLLNRNFYFESLFWTSLWIGTLTLISPLFALLFPVLTIHLIVIGRFTLRTLLIEIMGFFFPYLLVLAYRFIQNDQTLLSIFDSFTFHLQWSYLSHTIIIIFLLIAGVFSMLKVFSSLSRYMISVRNHFILLSMMSVLFLLLSFQAKPQYNLYAILPLSFLLAKMIESNQSTLWKDIYFVSLFLFAFSQEILNLTLI